MFDFRFIKDKLRGFVMRLRTNIKSFDVILYVKRVPKEAVSYPNPSELTPEKRYVLELEKAGKLRQVGDGIWQYTD